MYSTVIFFLAEFFMLIKFFQSKKSPNRSKEKDEQLWGTLLSMANTYKDNMLVMGDFNCGGINWIDVV